jgi:hypothetical protein
MPSQIQSDVRRTNDNGIYSVCGTGQVSGKDRVLCDGLAATERQPALYWKTDDQLSEHKKSR